MTKMIKCPCCEHESSYVEWYEVSNDDFAVCPKCDNRCTYDEFTEGTFE